MCNIFTFISDIYFNNMCNIFTFISDIYYNICSRTKIFSQLDISKKIKATLETNIHNIGIHSREKIINYVKNTIENEGSSFHEYISYYLIVDSVTLKNQHKLVFEIVMRINPYGKFRNIMEKTLTIDELIEKCYKNEIREHIAWSLDTAAFRCEPLFIIDEEDFVIRYSNIERINVYQ